MTKNKVILVFLVTLSVISIFLSARYGAVSLGISEMTSSLSKFFLGKEEFTLHERIFLELRLPRAFLAFFTGAALASGAVLMQGLFRNPLVDSGMIGISSGAAFGAALFFVMGSTFTFIPMWSLPFAAITGALLSSVILIALSGTQSRGKNSTVMILLIGIAINALFMSGTGFLSYIARDPQARSITFWGMGTLSGANWHSVKMVAGSTTLVFMISWIFSKSLNALILGEEEAFLLGTHVKRLKRWLIIGNVIICAVATAYVGVIGFVGLVVPHMVRLSGVSDHRYLLPFSALLGGVLLGFTDLLARMIVPPAELPLSIITSLAGVPLFILLLRKNYYTY